MKINPTSWTRRDALKTGALMGGLLGVGTVAACTNSKRPRNIIFMVSDGMSTGVPGLAEKLSQLSRNQETHWHRLSRDPKTTHGLFDMASMDSMVTDSAPAASAWGSGRRVPNRVINEFPDGTVLRPLCPILKEKGWATGLVTTARVTHATPAGFVAHVPHRDYEDEIALQYLNQVDIVLGGGDLHFSNTYRLDGVDLEGQFKQAGYSLLKTRDELLSAASSEQNRKMLGLFYPDHLPYTLDHQQDARLLREVPTLAEMTQAALQGLARSRKGFFLMVEAHASTTPPTATMPPPSSGISWPSMPHWARFWNFKTSSRHPDRHQQRSRQRQPRTQRHGPCLHRKQRILSSRARSQTFRHTPQAGLGIHASSQQVPLRASRDRTFPRKHRLQHESG
ncbi:MAG: twin-arginine translocation signal domain-containing protein [Blastochloris sp.]|nr:twin-arginine translocation signal domain-containing protein [Blastochloris sp.]